MRVEPLRFSRLRRMSKSAAHYAAYQDEDTASLRKGRALHSLLLGDTTDEAVAVCPPGMRRDLRHKAYQEWLKNHEGAEILSDSEAASVRGMRQSIERHSRALELLEGVREHTEYWTWLDRACRGTPDVVSARYLVELKTCRSSDPRQFPLEARRYHYHGQLAYYLNGLSIIRGPARIPSEVYIVAVESTVPYPVTVYRVTDELLEQGERSCRLWMEQLAVCEQSDAWPAYAESDVELGVYEQDAELDLSGLEEVA